MKILMIIDTLRAGGKERRLLELVKALYLRGVVCEIIILSQIIEYKTLNNLDIKLHFLERSGKSDFEIFHQLYKILKSSKPTVVQVWESMAAVYATPICKLLGIKLVNSMIGDAPKKIKSFDKVWVRIKLTFPFADLIVANSNAGLRSYNAPRHKSICLYNGIDMNRFRILEGKEKVKENFKIYTANVVGMVASFSKFKDYDTFIQAAMKVLSIRDDVTFVCVGDGPNLVELREMVSKHHKDKIIFTGQQKDVESIINVFDIGVLSTYTEGISNAIIEYMALAKPVIATRGGGTCELVQNNITGFLVSERSVNELVEKISELIENKDLAKQMGIKGKRKITTEFNLEDMTQNYLSLYASI